MSLSPFMSNQEMLERQSLAQDAAELREQYSFMVFKEERAKIKRQLMRNIQKQINVRPFDSLLWRELVFLQANDFLSINQSTADEREWTFLVSNQLSQWNPHERVTLLKRCVLFSSDIEADVSTVCSRLFGNALHQKTVDSLSHKLNITKIDLQIVIEYFGIDVDQVAK